MSDTTEKIVYWICSRAIIAKPHAVDDMNHMLNRCHVIKDWDKIQRAFEKQEARGAMLASEQPAQIELTGRRRGKCVEFKMPFLKPPDDEALWWTYHANIWEVSGESVRSLGEFDISQINHE